MFIKIRELTGWKFIGNLQEVQVNQIKSLDERPSYVIDEQYCNVYPDDPDGNVGYGNLIQIIVRKENDRWMEILSNSPDIYLCNDSGKTIERIR